MLRDGAYDYLVKNGEIKERLLNTLGHLIKTTNLEKKLAVLQQEVEGKYDFQKAIVGNSPALLAVFELMKRAVNTNINIFISGETGTGKELVAKAIHYNSDRKKNAYVPVNIAALSKDLVESELFGHEKGAFTGAIGSRKGRFAEANLGTLFLDEIAEMDLSMQTKLLRVLQEKEFSPIGSNMLIKTDFRLIVATHKNLSEEVRKGNFREDLYYRIMGLNLQLPPLRNRGYDVLLLASDFIHRFCLDNKMKEKKLNPAAQSMLLSHPFPGNVRELKSVVETAVVLSDGESISPADLVFQNAGDWQQMVQNELTLREYTYKIIQFMLHKYQNDIPQVAKKLDISTATIYRILKEFQDKKEDFSN